MKMAEKSQKDILAFIPFNRKIAIALDCWISKSGKTFLAITGYFFTEDFDYHEVLLGFESMHDLHERKYLTDVVVWVLTKHAFLNQVIAAITDGAKNNGIMMQEWKKKLDDGLTESNAFQSAFDEDIWEITHFTTHVPCLAHVIQLAVHTLLDEIKISAKNENVDVQWDDRVDDQMFNHHGLLSMLEKIRYFSMILFWWLTSANRYAKL